MHESIMYILEIKIPIVGDTNLKRVQVCFFCIKILL